MSIWNSVVHSVRFCACSQHLVHSWWWFDITNLSPSSLSSEAWETFRQTAARTHIYFLQVTMLLSPSLLPQEDARGASSTGQGERRSGRGETGLLKECRKERFLPPSVLPGQSRLWGGLWAEALSSHVYAVSCITKPCCQMGPIGDAPWGTDSSVQKGKEDAGGGRHKQQRNFNNGLHMCQ